MDLFQGQHAQKAIAAPMQHRLAAFQRVQIAGVLLGTAALSAWAEVLMAHSAWQPRRC